MSPRIPLIAALALSMVSVSYAQPPKPGPGPRPQPTPQPGQRDPAVGPPSGPLMGTPEYSPVAKLRFTAPEAGAVSFPAVAPGGQLTVRTAGGVLPITMNVEAGAHAALFEIVGASPGDGTNLGDKFRAPVQKNDPASKLKQTPAGPIERVLKFKGAASAGTVPSQIPITVVAIDGNRDRVTLALTVYPVAPRLAAVDSPIDPYKTISFPLNFSGLGGAEGIAVQKLVGCSIFLNPHIQYPGSHPVQAGTATSFRVAILGATEASCTVTATIALRLPGRTALEAPITVSAPVKLAPRQSYRFTDTWALRERLNFRLHEINANRGTCTGDSIGLLPPFPSFPVGVREHGGDISIAIRSGPLSTTCFYRSDQWVLPDGVTLKSFKVKQTTDGPPNSNRKVTCSAFDISDTGDLMTPTVRGLEKIYPDNDPGEDHAASYMLSGWGPLVTRGGVTLLENNKRFTTIIVPLFARLKCFDTVTNDHGMRLRIEQIEFLGPASLTLP